MDTSSRSMEGSPRSPMTLTNCSGSTANLQTVQTGKHPLPTGEFDLTTYAAFYAGHSKTARLNHIASVCPQLSDDALRQLVAAFEANGNIVEYAKLRGGEHQSKVASMGNDGWVIERQKNSNVQIGKLELALREAGDNHAAARAGYVNLGDVYYSIGDLVRAKKDFYQHALEHGCSLEQDPNEYRQCCLRMVKASINNIGTTFNMNDHLTKAKVGADLATAAQLEASKGLSSLVLAAKGLHGGAGSGQDHNIKQAALCFLRTTVDMDYHFNEVSVPQDIAAYAGLCALATLNRDEIQQQMIQSRSFKKMLSLAPMVESVVKNFYDSNYTLMLDTMNKLRPILELDVYFHGLVNRVYTAIVSRAMIQFVSPYAVVKLPEMAEIFGVSQSVLQVQLCELILENKIAARIDARNGSLIASNKTIRTDAFDKAIGAGDQIEDALVRMLLTKSILKDKLEVVDPRKKEMMAAMAHGQGMMGGMMGGMGFP